MESIKELWMWLWLRFNNRKILHIAKNSTLRIEVTLDTDGNKAMGTGFVVAANRICTTKHTLQGARSITVFTNDKRRFEVNLNNVHKDSMLDIAFIDIPDLDLTPIEIDTNLPQSGTKPLTVTQTRFGYKLGRGRVSFDVDELEFVAPKLDTLTQQTELSLLIKVTDEGDSGSLILAPNGKAVGIITAYTPTAVIKFKDSSTDRGIRLYALTLFTRGSSIKDALEKLSK